MTTNIDLAKEVAKCVALHSVTMCRANVESDLDPLNIPSEVGMTQGYRCNFKREMGDEREKLTVIADFVFFAKEMDGEAEVKDLVVVNASFMLIYSLEANSGIDEKCFKHFSDVNGPYNAWPYWRELVQSVSGRVGLAGVTVPVFRPQSVELCFSDSHESSQ